MSRRPAQAPPRRPLVLLGLMTVATFLGPFVIALVIAGGRRSSWPPDRPVEWWTFGLICGTVVVLMLGCLASAFGTSRVRPGDDPANPAPKKPPLPPSSVGGEFDP